jgi:lipoate-protein ligase A
MELHEVDYKVPNGKLVRVSAKVEGDKIVSARITGDFFLHPEESIFELERALIGKQLEKVTLQKTAERALAGCEMVGVSPEEFVNALLKLQSASL